MRKITESLHDYKGFIIKLRAVEGNGFWYKIFKPTPNSDSPGGFKNIYLRERGFNFILPDELLSKAKNYIDEFEIKLIEKFNQKTPPSIEGR